MPHAGSSAGTPCRSSSAPSVVRQACASRSVSSATDRGVFPEWNWSVSSPYSLAFRLPPVAFADGLPRSTPPPVIGSRELSCPRVWYFAVLRLLTEHRPPLRLLGL